MIIRKLSLHSRLYLLVGAMTFFVAGLLWFQWLSTHTVNENAGRELENVMKRGQQEKLRTSVHALALTLGGAVSSLPDQAARLAAAKRLSSDIRFDDDRSGYFFIYAGTTAISVPATPEVEGKDRRDAKDSRGVYLVRELQRAAQTGGGFVTYSFRKPGAGEVPKMAYAELIPGTDAFIGAGVYLDNIERVRQSMLSEMGAVGSRTMMQALLSVAVMMLLVMLPLAIVVTRSIARPVNALIEHVGRVSRRDFVSRCEGEAGDEVGRLIGAVNAMTGDLERMSGEHQALVERERVAAEALRRKVDVLLAAVRGIAAGDLTQEVSVGGGDAIGQLGEGLASLVRDLNGNMAAVTTNARSLAASSNQLNEASQFMAANSEETSAQAGAVSAAAEQVSKNVHSVAVAAEQMTASIKEISSNAQAAARIATTAVQVADVTSTTISKLGDSSKEIGKVLQVITSIAEQTNLLALNATIEAARAGEAGKGFAVVANEVKELAKETAKATEDIGNKVQAIQGDTDAAIKAIKEIHTIIGQVHDISTTIAGAVEEQTATTNEIGRSVTEAARGASEIARNISGVAESAQNTAEGATQTQTAATSLLGMAGALQSVVGRFRTDRAVN